MPEPALIEGLSQKIINLEEKVRMIPGIKTNISMLTKILDHQEKKLEEFARLDARKHTGQDRWEPKSEQLFHAEKRGATSTSSE